MLLPLSFSSHVFLLLLMSSLLFLWLILRHNGTSPSTMRCFSRPPPFPLNYSILFVSSSLLFLLFLTCVGESSSTFIRLFLLSSWFPRSEIILSLLVVSPSSRLLIPFSRLLTIVAMNFLSAIFASVLQLHPQHLGICWTWDIHLGMFLPQSVLRLTRVLQSNSKRSSWEECCVSYECNIWHIPIFRCGIFLQHPLISLF